jgi:DNA-directed RNA polymerase sigma subunit (sigma70/sigma32)
MAWRSVPGSDQEGTLGLNRAVEKFDWQAAMFST